jgi:hypothetical protein
MPCLTPHRKEALKQLVAAFVALAGVMGLAVLYNAPARKPTVRLPLPLPLPPILVSVSVSLHLSLLLVVNHAG